MTKHKLTDQQSQVYHAENHLVPGWLTSSNAVAALPGTLYQVFGAPLNQANQEPQS